MIIYNVTTKVAHAINSDWLTWMKNVHIPEIIATGCFTHATILKLMEVEEEEGVTYAVQYHAESRALYNKYISEYASSLRDNAFKKWGNGFISFRSVMQIVN